MIRKVNLKFLAGIPLFALFLVVLYISYSFRSDPNSSLPVAVLSSSYGVETSLTPTLSPPIQVVIPSELTNQVSAYAGVAGTIVLGPKGWTGHSSEGADGNIFVNLYPVDGSISSGPHISVEEYPACVGCIVDAAAPYFASAREEAVKYYPGTPLEVPPGTVIRSLSPTLIKYKLSTSALITTGLAFYPAPVGPGQLPYFFKIEVALPNNQQSLSDFLLKDAVERYRLR